MSVNFFRTRREAMGLTQVKVADALGISMAAVSAWERGLACPDITFTAKLAPLYGVSDSTLLNEIVRVRSKRREPAKAAG